LASDLRARGEQALTGCHHQQPDLGTPKPEPRT
jgi:hypothetical protein